VQLKVVVELSWRHELPDDVIGDVTASRLVGGDYALQQCDQLLLQLPGQHRTAAVALPHLSESFVVLEEEGEVLIGDVDITVAPLGTVLFYRGAAPRERIVVDLVFDGVGVIGEVD